MDTLVLNAGYEPVDRVNWQRAITLLCEEKVEVVAEYPDRSLRSASVEWKMPSVIRFMNLQRRNRKGVKFSRESVYARDGGKCAYCAHKVARNDFTYDHIIPRSQGGQTSWTNVVVCCTPCNQKKGGRTPAQAGMLWPKAFKPSRDQIPESLILHLSWHPGMPESWRNFMRSSLYWKDDLDSDDEAA